MNYKFEWKFKDGADHYEQLYLGCESLADALQNWCIYWLAIENDEQVQPDDYCDFFTITKVEQLPIASQCVQSKSKRLRDDEKLCIARHQRAKHIIDEEKKIC